MEFNRGENRLHHVLPGAEDVPIYEDDLELLERLTKDREFQVEVLTEESPDQTFPIKIAHITQVTINGGEPAWTLEIWRADMPAQFYCFRVNDWEGHQHLITTGSGSLKDYWATLELVGGAMFYCTSEES